MFKQGEQMKKGAKRLLNSTSKSEQTDTHTHTHTHMDISTYKKASAQRADALKSSETLTMIN